MGFVCLCLKTEDTQHFATMCHQKSHGERDDWPFVFEDLQAIPRCFLVKGCHQIQVGTRFEFQSSFHPDEGGW